MSAMNIINILIIVGNKKTVMVSYSLLEISRKIFSRIFLTFLTYLVRFLHESYKNILTSSCKI